MRRLSRWAERNECDEPNDQEDLFDGDVHHLTWTCKGQEGALEHYKTDSQSMHLPKPQRPFSPSFLSFFPLSSSC